MEPELIAERNRDKEVHKRRLATLCRTHPILIEAVDAALTSFNGTPGDARSFDALHELLEAQAYSLAYWRVASDEINYRRFFDINELAGLRMEQPAVFADTHVNMGIGAGDGGQLIWPFLIGVNRAKYYLMTGDRITGREALEMGLANFYVEEQEALLPKAFEVARRLAGKSIPSEGTA